LDWKNESFFVMPFRVGPYFSMPVLIVSDGDVEP